jgi:uncharacterized membrane protein
MKVPSLEAWLIVAVVSAVSAGISAVFLVLSISDRNALDTVLSAVALVLFIACLMVALTARSKLSRLEKTEVEIRYVKLKKPGVIREQQDEIVPKGKQPKE